MDVAMGDVQSPARPEDQVTPTASQLPFLAPTPSQPQISQPLDLSTQKTPTRDSFVSVGGGEKRPHEPSSAAESGATAETPNKSRNRKSGSYNTSEHRTSQDVEMENNEDDGGSDNESTADGSGRPSKKKKGQRFFCTDFPPCQLSFTRSEHLARHIRKHTGERPFQCHCLRRFSRLDNLRQHAQTVHVNEEIPGDSLAATGTRFQRQVRTDRVRPAGGRARASTLGSNSGGHGTQGRGHSRNLSGSSIGSTSDFGSPDTGRRQPPPIAMAQNTSPRPGLTLDTYSATTMNNDAHYPPNYGYSPSGYSTPTSVFSNDPSSPRAPSGLQSPISMAPRPIGWGGQNHSRRLSVPSGANPFQSPGIQHSPATPFMSSLGSPSGSAFSGASNAFGSPTRGGHYDGQAEPLTAAEAEWRRRTWHPGTRMSTESRPATSGLTYYQTPDAPQPVPSSQPAAQQAIRLPGIDSFDRVHAQPNAPRRNAPSEMDVDDQSQAGETDTSSKRDSWNSVNQNFNQLDITHNNSSQETRLWRHSTGSHPPSSTRPTTAPHSGFAKHVPPPLALVNSREPPNLPGDQPTTPKKKKRQGIYVAPAPEPTGPHTAVRTSPEGSSSSGENIPTPGTYPGSELHPTIVHSNGSIEALPHASMADDPPKDRSTAAPDVTTFPMQQQMPPHPPPSVDPNPPRRGDDTGRLDALVAVATGDEQAFTNR